MYMYIFFYANKQLIKKSPVISYGSGALALSIEMMGQFNDEAIKIIAQIAE